MAKKGPNGYIDIYKKGSIPHNKGQKSTGTTSPVKCLCLISRLSKEEFRTLYRSRRMEYFIQLAMLITETVN
uniref:Uncharacterized protein n=1 Tax=Magallana gigas TaxID=29159 RepID=K1QA52_MAGGI